MDHGSVLRRGGADGVGEEAALVHLGVDVVLDIHPAGVDDHDMDSKIRRSIPVEEDRDGDMMVLASLGALVPNGVGGIHSDRVFFRLQPW